MKTLTKAFSRPLQHPEFTTPGFLALLIGAAFGTAAWMWGDRGIEFPLLSGLLLLTGITLLLKSRVGTVLLLLVMILCLYDAIGGIEFTWSRAPRLLAGLLFWISMFVCVGCQLEFHRSRKERFAISPPN